MFEETPPPTDIGTPTKRSDNAPPPTIFTPSGNRIFNPFQEGYVEKLGCVTVTPGVFASGHRGEVKTPSRGKLAPPFNPPPFLWSPEAQGDLFPTEIDENPTLQMKLQQTLDADVSYY